MQELPKTLFHTVNSGSSSRRIAYTQQGELSAKHVFLCLPGLLETGSSFYSLFDHAANLDDCCWLAVDYCGRGKSDPLPIHENYSTSVYLADTQDLIATLLRSIHPSPSRKLHLIGTSMGGILSMHLAKNLNGQVDCLVLNDIGMSLHWSALIDLYRQLNATSSVFDDIQIDPRAIEAVSAASHFDLPYDFDLISMQFHPLLKNHSGKVALLHNENSTICPTGIAEQAKRRIPHLKIWTQAGGSHPAVWTSSSVNKLCQLLKLKPKTTETAQLIANEASSADTAELAPSDQSFVPSFLRTSEAYLTSTSKTSHGLLSSLRQWLRGASRCFS